VALFGAGYFYNNRRKSHTQSAVIKEAWAWVASILPSLEKAAEKTIKAQDFNRLAQLESEVHRFEQVLDSLDVPALVQGGVFESEAAVRDMRKGMLVRIEVLWNASKRLSPLRLKRSRRSLSRGQDSLAKRERCLSGMNEPQPSSWLRS
jgi:hypothetical protein